MKLYESSLLRVPLRVGKATHRDEPTPRALSCRPTLVSTDRAEILGHGKNFRPAFAELCRLNRVARGGKKGLTCNLFFARHRSEHNAHRSEEARVAILCTSVHIPKEREPPRGARAEHSRRHAVRRPGRRDEVQVLERKEERREVPLRRARGRAVLGARAPGWQRREAERPADWKAETN